MFGSKKIITAKQLQTVKAKDSAVMKDFVAKGGGKIVRKKFGQKELWGELRNESKSRKVGQRGYTKEGLTDFLGELLVNKKDDLADRKVKEIADLYGIKRKNVYDAAAKAKHAKITASSQQKQAAAPQIQAQKDAQFRKEIESIIAAGKARTALAKAGSSRMSSNEGEKIMREPINIKTFSMKSDAKIKIAQTGGIIADSTASVQSEKDHFESFSHERSRLQNHSEKDEEEVKRIKAILARIQGKTDEGKGDQEMKLAA